jgi:SAM-dependent methyltransferase
VKSDFLHRGSEAGEADISTGELSEADLVRFCAGLFPPEPMSDMLVNEARFGLGRVLPVLTSLDVAEPDILEVGGGSCILSAYLASKGLNVTVVEPLGPEFDFFADRQSRVLDFAKTKALRLSVQRISGEALEACDQFHLAFTINALEHMRDPWRVIDNMYRSVKPGGRVLACCPNYTVPFEPHVNVLLITRSKRLNGWLYRSRIRRYASVWEGLTFVRQSDLRRHLARGGLAFTFNRAALRDSVARVFEDPIFRRRMPRVLRALAAGLRRSGLLHALTVVPLPLQTPMEVVITKRSP